MIHKSRLYVEQNLQDYDNLKIQTVFVASKTLYLFQSLSLVPANIIHGRAKC